MLRFYRLMTAKTLAALVLFFCNSLVSAEFVHPGVAHSQAQIDFVKSKIEAGEEPWLSRWEKIQGSRYAGLKWESHPQVHVERGPYNIPDIGSSEFSGDGRAAYMQAICWNLTGDVRHAEKTMEILDGWSSTLKSISNHDAALLVGMSGYHYCVAGELLAHTWDGWPEENQARFQGMLRNLFYPLIKDFYPTANGNWDAAMLQVMLGMGVHLEDQAMYDQAKNYFLSGKGNGAIGNYFMESGQCQESGRDQAHTQMGLEFLANTCETAWIQGEDLYGALDNRLLKGFEYTAKYNLGYDVPYKPYRSYKGRYNYESLSSDSRGGLRPMYERVLNHYQNRKGLPALYTKEAALKLRKKASSSWRRSSAFDTLMYYRQPAEFTATKTKIVCFGDSITKRGYPAILSSLLNVDVANAGVGGHTSAQGLKRMTSDVLEENPDVVVVFFGTNDLRVDSEKHVALEDYAKNLNAMVTRCAAQGAQVILCTLPPIETEEYFKRHEQSVYESAGGLQGLIQQYRGAAVGVAAATDTPIVDLNALLKNTPEWLSKDGVHPSEQGSAIIAKHIAKIVAPLLPARTKGISASKATNADILVYGATSSGIISAVQAARMNRSVILIGADKHVGGLTTGGLGATDIGNKDVIGGLSREFYHEVAKHYQDDAAWIHETREEFFASRSKRTKLEEVIGEDATMWSFEPHVATAIFEKMMEKEGITLVREKKVASVEKSDARISKITTDDGSVYSAAMFIDATYEGDLMAKAGVEYRVGREANAEFNETLNGILPKTPKNQMAGFVDPYVIPGDPTSGLIPLVDEGDGGTPGEGDHRVQAYNFRLCFTNVESNRLPLDPPANYDPAVYEIVARQAEVRLAKGQTLKMRNFCTPVWMPNGKSDINNGQGISTDFIGANYDYPDGTPEQRAEIWQRHEDYVRGLWHFLSTSPRLPKYLREEFSSYGPCRDEFEEQKGFSPQLYVREARRMVSDYVMTEHNCRTKTIAEDPIGMAAYGMDSHNCQRIVKGGRIRNEGDVQAHGLKPYGISYRSIIPKADQCENLLVPVCVSSTHIAFGSIRMEPVFMVLGQSAAIAASLAIENETPVQNLDYPKLRSLLWASDQVLKRPKK